MISFRFTQAVILFECGQPYDAISRVDDLIDIVDNKSLYITVRVRERYHYLRESLTRKLQAQMSLLLGGILVSKGDYDRGMSFHLNLALT